MIVRKEILKGEKCPEHLEENLSHLLECLNKLRKLWGRPMKVTSGYRTFDHNKKIHGAKNSAHLFCQAADIADPRGELARFLTLEILEECGLWMEDPHYSPSWCHLQSRPARARIFKPF